MSSKSIDIQHPSATIQKKETIRKFATGKQAAIAPIGGPLAAEAAG
jgi:hypothetical protein